MAVDSLRLSDIVNLNGKNIMSGMASGIKIEDQVAIKVKPTQTIVDKIEKSVTLNNNKIQALKDLKDDLTMFQTALNKLRNPPGISGVTDNSFNMRSIDLNTDDSSIASNFISVTADPGATIGNREIIVTQIAKNQVRQIGPTNPSPGTLATQTGFSSNTTSVVNADGSGNKFKAGTFRLDGKVDRFITLAVDDSLITIAAKINYASKDTEVGAEIVKVGQTDYRLKLYSLNTGMSNAFLIDDSADNVFGTLNEEGIRSASDAKMLLDGTEVTRSSNLINDVVPNLTFELKSVNSVGKKLMLKVDYNREKVLEDVKNLATFYNNLKESIAKQKEKDENYVLKETSYLGRERVLDRIESELRTYLPAKVIGIDNSQLNSLGQVGIMLDYTKIADPEAETPLVQNLMSINETLLSKALYENIEQVKTLFGLNFNAPSDRLQINQRSAIFKINDFKVNFKSDNLAGTFNTDEKVALTYVDATSATQTVYADFVQSSQSTPTKTYGTITGRKGTVFEGLNMTYIGGAPGNLETVDVSMTQGIADILHIITDNFTKFEGVIDTEIRSLTTKNILEKTSLDMAKNRLESLRAIETTKFAKLEQEIMKMNQSLLFIDINQNQKNNN